MEESFARVEVKYMLTSARLPVFEAGLRSHGFCCRDFGSPLVQSLYYDSPDRLLIRSSLERPAYKEKLRLRAYGQPGAASMSFVEVKKKYRGVVYKRRTALPLEEAARGLQERLLPAETGQVGREALWMVRRWNLVPSAVIAYNRSAWFSSLEPEIRITLDRNISFRDYDLDLSLPSENIPLILPDQRILEIKTGGVYPRWLAELLQAAGAKRIHFSKYGTAYQRYMCFGTHSKGAIHCA